MRLGTRHILLGAPVFVMDRMGYDAAPSTPLRSGTAKRVCVILCALNNETPVVGRFAKMYPVDR